MAGPPQGRTIAEQGHQEPHLDPEHRGGREGRHVSQEEQEAAREREGQSDENRGVDGIELGHVHRRTAASALVALNTDRSAASASPPARRNPPMWLNITPFMSHFELS